MDKLRILFLCRKYYYLHKMSRVRFHAARAIGAVTDMLYSGPEWENWDPTEPAEANIRSLYRGKPLPHFVLCYRPEEIPGLQDISIPLVLNRDEMFTEEIPAEQTVHRITESKIDLLIAHQKKQLEHPLFEYLPCKFGYIPYCADTTLFKDYQLPRKTDVLIIGNRAKNRYPLRHKLYEYLMAMRSDPEMINYTLSVFPYPGYRLAEAHTDAHVVDYAKCISQAKICMTCSGKFHLKYAKYVEIPACRTLLVADMPGEDQEVLGEYMAEIAPDITYDSLKKTLLHYLVNDQERQRLADKGYEIVRARFSQENYAAQFVAIAREYLAEHGTKKIWS